MYQFISATHKFLDILFLFLLCLMSSFIASVRIMIPRSTPLSVSMQSLGTKCPQEKQCFPFVSTISLFTRPRLNVANGERRYRSQKACSQLNSTFYLFFVQITLGGKLADLILVASLLFIRLMCFSIVFVFGSYSARTSQQNSVSFYRNLQCDLK